MIFSNARSNALPDSSAPSFRAVSRGPSGSGAETQIPDPPHPLGLLRGRRERPRGRRAAKQRYELASFHCPVSPVLPAERIARLSSAGDCRAADFDPTYVGLASDSAL